MKCDGSNPCELCVGYGYSCVYVNSQISTTKPVVSKESTSPPTLSLIQQQTSIPPKFHVPDTPEASKHLYVFSEERQSPKPGDTRFTRVDSAIAFPRSLGLSLNADNPPRLKSFAWNTGTRPKKVESVRTSIFQYTTLEDVEIYSSIYFTSINPIFQIIDREEFKKRANFCASIQTIDAGFEVVLCGVIALGSLFSRHKFPHEEDIIEQARLTLDRTFATSNVLLSVDFVVGWVLRALYLRSTTKPHVSWMASSMAMHIAESIGLHQEISDIKLCQKEQRDLIMSEADIEQRRRIFWVASSLNRLFCAQYGRTMILLQNIGCRYPARTSDDTADDFVSLMHLLPCVCDPGNPSSIATLTEGLMQLGKVKISEKPLLLLRADAIFCIYRKLRYMGFTLSQAQIEVVRCSIRLALDAADSLAIQQQQWWSIIGVPFHSICVLLALNTPESLSLVYKSMETLQNVTMIFNSHVSREALRTAHYLVKAAEKKRRGELEALQRSLNLSANMLASPVAQTPVSDGMGDLPSFEWPTDFELGFSDLLDTSFLNEDIGMTNGFH